MLNKSGVNRKTYTAPVQILANVELQYSVGAIVAEALGVDVNGQKIAKAGTPVVIDTMDDREPVVAPIAGPEGTEPNGILLHDVDVTTANANGTVLLFGVVNVNRVEDDVALKLEAITTNKVGDVFLVKR